MESKTIMRIIGAEFPPELEQEGNEWFEKVHLPMVLETPGMRRASRYQIIEPVPNFTKYITVYEMCNEASMAFQGATPITQAIKEDSQKRWHGALSVKWRVNYKLIVP